MGAFCGKGVQDSVDNGQGKPSEPPPSTGVVPDKTAQPDGAASPTGAVAASPGASAGVKHGSKDQLNRYTMKSGLGKGRYGTVKVCVDNETNKEYAIKIINGKTLKDPSIIDEEVFKLQKVGNHPNIVAFHEFFKDDANGMFYIVMELCRGGDLFSRIVEDGGYSEKRAAELLRQLANALVFIHGLGITHRDLKPENILLSSKSPDAVVKIVDFGLSKLVKDKLMETMIGTWAYCAPEVFSRQPYDSSVDTWALGIIMFIMLAGYHPFDPYGELSDGEMISKIQNEDFNFDEPEWEGISDDAKFIIRQLLQKSPAKRMSLETFLQQPWVTGVSTGNADLTASLKRLQSFSKAHATAGKQVNSIGKIQEDDPELKENEELDDEEPGVVHFDKA